MILQDQDLWIVPLVCPDCGGRLIVECGSVIFPCACGALWEPEGDTLSRRELHVLSGTGDTYLPFWLLSFHVAMGEESVGNLGRFRLLTGGSRRALERHQTLRHAVQWSYDLLSEAEKRLRDPAASTDPIEPRSELRDGGATRSGLASPERT